MTDDFYLRTAREQYKVLQTQIQKCEAELAEHEANGDEYEPRQLMGDRSVLRAAQAALEHDYNERVRKLNHREPEMTDAEFVAMSPERMAQNPVAVDRIFSKSKYYTPNQWADPEVAKRTAAGVQGVIRREDVDTASPIQNPLGELQRGLDKEQSPDKCTPMLKHVAPPARHPSLGAATFECAGGR